MTELDAQANPTDETEATAEPPAPDASQAWAHAALPDAAEPPDAAATDEAATDEATADEATADEALPAGTPDDQAGAAADAAPAEAVVEEPAETGPRTVGRFIADALRAAGVRYAFTVPGE